MASVLGALPPLGQRRRTGLNDPDPDLGDGRARLCIRLAHDFGLRRLKKAKSGGQLTFCGGRKIILTCRVARTRAARKTELTPLFFAL